MATICESESSDSVASHSAFTAAIEIAALDFNPLLGGIFDATAQCISPFSIPSGKANPLYNSIVALVVATTDRRFDRVVAIPGTAAARRRGVPRSRSHPSVPHALSPSRARLAATMQNL